MATRPPVARALPTIRGPVAERAARATGLVPRAAKLPGARFVQTPVFGWLAQPRARVSPPVQTAAPLGVPLTPQALDERFSQASAACRRAVVVAAVRVVLAADPVAVPVLRRFTPVAVQDGTTIARPAALATVWPGGGGSTATGGAAALTRGVRLDLVTGQLVGPYVEAGRANDRATTVADQPPPPGALRLADLGFFRPDEPGARAARGACWRSRWQPGTARFTPDGQRQELVALLPAATGAPLDLAVRRGVRPRVPARLLAVRVPQAVADQRRRRRRATARDQGRTVSADRLALCAWTVLLTNVPPDRLPRREARARARARWQIALLFTRWKRHLRVDEWRSAHPWRVRTEVEAKLLAAIVQHRRVLGGGWHHPDRRLVTAARASQAHARHLAAGFDAYPQLCRALQAVARGLAASRLNTRKAAPTTVPLLLTLEAATLA